MSSKHPQGITFKGKVIVLGLCILSVLNDRQAKNQEPFSQEWRGVMTRSLLLISTVYLLIKQHSHDQRRRTCGLTWQSEQLLWSNPAEPHWDGSDGETESHGESLQYQSRRTTEKQFLIISPPKFYVLHPNVCDSACVCHRPWPCSSLNPGQWSSTAPAAVLVAQNQSPVWVLHPAWSDPPYSQTDERWSTQRHTGIMGN